MQPGQQLTPTIRLVRPLGQGAMGHIWVADHLTLGTQVAVKLMAPAYQGDADFVARFRQEARAAAQLRSQHVVQVLDHGVTDEGQLYIVMELLEGETLRRRMQRLGPLPLAEVTRVVTHTARALTRAHGAGIIHRDIKPDNLFVTATEVEGEPLVKVLDFGIAKHPQAVGSLEMTTTGRTLGTPLYMSPEQLVSAKHVDHRTDLWSLGVVAYKALTGRLPFLGETVAALAVAVHAGEYPRPSALRRDLPEAVDAWMARALQRDPGSRFDSAADMAAALEKAAATEKAATEAEQGRARKSSRSSSAKLKAVAPSTAPPREPPVPSSSRPPAQAVVPPGADSSFARAVAQAQIGARRIQVVHANITEPARAVRTEAIVCPWSGATPNLMTRAIAREAGSQVYQEMRSRPIERRGIAVLTSAGNLPPPARFIIHALAPDCVMGMGHRRDSALEASYLEELQQAHKASLALAEKHSLRSLSFAAFDRFYYDSPYEKMSAVAMGAAVDHLSRDAGSVELIVFVLITTGSYQAYASALGARARG